MIVQFFIVLKDYLIEVLSFLAVGFFLSGLIHEFVPSGWVERRLGGKGIKPLLFHILRGDNDRLDHGSRWKSDQGQA